MGHVRGLPGGQQRLVDAEVKIPSKGTFYCYSNDFNAMQNDLQKKEKREIAQEREKKRIFSISYRMDSYPHTHHHHQSSHLRLLQDHNVPFVENWREQRELRRPI